MIDSSMFLEKFLQNYRFKIIKPYLLRDVLDFGGNRGELGKFVKGNYLVVNDYSLMEEKTFDTIVALAVIEHTEFNEVFEIFKKFRQKHLRKGGKIVLTTPTKITKSVLEFLAFIGLLDKENIKEHKHYWDKKEIYQLAKVSGFAVEKYAKFQLGFNQLAVFKK